MKKGFSVVLVILVLAGLGAQLRFDLAERAYVRQIANTELKLLNTVCVQDTEKKIVCATPGDIANIASLISTEFPSQVTDYLAKVNAVKK